MYSPVARVIRDLQINKTNVKTDRKKFLKFLNSFKLGIGIGKFMPEEKGKQIYPT